MIPAALIRVACMSYSVVIRGPLGVGKSTVSSLLARALGAQHISIDRVLEDHGIEEWDRDRISLRSFLKANEIAVDQARKALEAGRPVIFDGCFYWREQLEDLAQRLGGKVAVFSLQAPLEACIGRDRARPLPQAGEAPRGGHQLGDQAVAEVFRLVASVDYGMAIDASGALEATVAAILGRLSSSDEQG